MLRARPALLALALACAATESAAPPPPPAATITLLAYHATPGAVTVPPGATLLFRNLDAGDDHLLASEAVAGSYQPGAVNGVSFELFLPAGESVPLGLPATAPPGTALPYFCRLHGAAEGTLGTITVAP